MTRAFAAILAGALFAAATPAQAQQPNPEWIRVAVAKGDPEVTLQILGRYSMVALHTGDRIQEEPRLLSSQVRGVPQGLAVGEAIVPYLGVRIEPARDAAIHVNGKRLRGSLEIVRQRDMTLLVVNYIALEDYLRGVLSKEAPDYWPEEALQAIAIAARTYAIYQRLTKAAGDYDVTADVMSQDYGGKNAEKAATSRAVKRTAGLILLYQGKLFPPFYHSTCGGVTESGRAMGKYDIPPLAGGVPCRLCYASPFFSWQRRVTKADLGWALKKSKHGSIGQVRDLAVTQRTAFGRVKELTVAGTLRTLKLTGFDLRALLGFENIRSPLFEIRPADLEAFFFEGHGWGHGVGLCQWGAAELARRGLSAREILAYYYPSTELVRLQDVADRPMIVIGGSS